MTNECRPKKRLNIHELIDSIHCAKRKYVLPCETYFKMCCRNMTPVQTFQNEGKRPTTYQPLWSKARVPNNWAKYREEVAYWATQRGRTSSYLYFIFVFYFFSHRRRVPLGQSTEYLIDYQMTKDVLLWTSGVPTLLSKCSSRSCEELMLAKIWKEKFKTHLESSFEKENRPNILNREKKKNPKGWTSSMKRNKRTVPTN